MKLTVLGTAGGGVPSPGSAGSGYLLQEEGVNVLLDCGNGTLGNLVRHVDYGQVDALLITHFPYDHCLDLFPLLLVYRKTGKLPIYHPSGGREVLSAFFRTLSSHPHLYIDAMENHDVRDGEIVEIGGLSFQFFQVQHDLEAYSIVVDGGKLVYSGDTGDCEGIRKAAKGARLFLCESTFLESDTLSKESASHLTARKAGEIGREAGVERMLITHLKYGNDPAAALKEASETFGEGVDLAKENVSYEI